MNSLDKAFPHLQHAFRGEKELGVQRKKERNRINQRLYKKRKREGTILTSQEIHKIRMKNQLKAVIARKCGKTEE